MNPSFTAMQKAWMTTMSNMMFGIEHKPKEKGTQETSINGRAFAPGKGVQQEVSSEEKEAKVRTHLDKLAAEAKARYLAACAKLPTIGEIAAERHRNHQAYIDRQILLNRTTYIDRGTEVEPVEPKYPTSDLIDALHEHIAEVKEQERKNRITFNTKAESKVMTALYGSDNGAEIDETSTHDQVIQKLHETHKTYIERRIETRREAAVDAAIHTGDGRFEAK